MNRTLSSCVLLLLMLPAGIGRADENEKYVWLMPEPIYQGGKPAVDPLEWAREKLTPNNFAPIYASGRDGELIDAARRNDLPRVEDLLKQDARANAQDELGWRPLIYASLNGNAEMVRSLLAHYADPNVKGGGYRPLEAAALRGHVVVVRMLIHAGALLDQKGSNGNTPLIDAVFTNRVDIIRILLKHGADPAIFNSQKWNAMSVAAITGNREAMEALLSEGVDPNLLDGAGNSPLYWAMNSQQPEMESLLSQHGAVVSFVFH